MTDRILCVDDDPNVLESYQRAFRKQFRIDIALGGDEALEAIINQGPYAVVVADMQMPGMNGVELLKRVKEHGKDTVRMMLTGNADQQTALEAVNEGHVFRFVTKPCPPETFAKVLNAGLEQYRLIRAERDLLSKTFSASVKVLTDVLSAVSPTAFGRASRVRQMARNLCQELELNDWQIEVAAMLSQIGCVSIPDHILVKAYEGRDLSHTERTIFESYPESGTQLISNIPRLEEVSRIITYQQQHYDGGGIPGDGTSESDIPLGSRVLKIALDLDTLSAAGYSKETAVAEMNYREGWYDPSMLPALSNVLAITDVQVVCSVKIPQLVDGLILADDIVTRSGVLVCAKGQEVTRAMRFRLKNYLVNIGIQSSVKVFVPSEMVASIVKRDCPTAVS